MYLYSIHSISLTVIGLHWLMTKLIVNHLSTTNTNYRIFNFPILLTNISPSEIHSTEKIEGIPFEINLKHFDVAMDFV